MVELLLWALFIFVVLAFNALDKKERRRKQEEMRPPDDDRGA